MISNARVFLDTNILIRYDIADMPQHLQVRAAMLTLSENDCEFWISRQVVREYCRATTHPNFPQPLDMLITVQRVRQFLPFFQIADEDHAVMQKFLTLLETIPIGGKQVHDANIVATMQSVGIKYLLTLNDDDFKRFDSLITILKLSDL